MTAGLAIQATIGLHEPAASARGPASACWPRGPPAALLAGGLLLRLRDA